MDGLRDYFLLDKKPCLTIVVNLSIEELQEASNIIKSNYLIPSISITRELATLLVRKPQADKSKEIIVWISEKIQEIVEEPILLTNIDILFEPSF